ncbi:MAG: hydrolase [Candidatus Peregrinibacteria bacterium]
MNLPPPEKPETGCCPRFDPAPWQDKEMTWSNKRFVKEHVRAFLRIPIGFGAVMKRVMEKIGAVQALAVPPLWLSDEKSWWGSDLYVAVTKDVPGAEMATFSGTMYTRVFEGPYYNAPLWARELTKFLRAKGKEPKKILYFYTTCPKCAKVYGKNYVVVIAQTN